MQNGPRDSPLKLILTSSKHQRVNKLYLASLIRRMCHRSEFLVETPQQQCTGCKKALERSTDALWQRCCSSLAPTSSYCSIVCSLSCSSGAQTARSSRWRRLRRGGSGWGRERPCWTWCSYSDGGPATTPGAPPSIIVLMLHQHRLSSSTTTLSCSLHSMFSQYVLRHQSQSHCFINRLDADRETFHILKLGRPLRMPFTLALRMGAEAKIGGSMAWRHCQREMRPIQSLFGGIVRRSSRS